MRVQPWEDRPAAPGLIEQARGILAGRFPHPAGNDSPQRRVGQRIAGGTRAQAVPPPGELTINTRRDADAVIIVLAGELDLPVAASVRVAVTRALREPRQRLIIDLSGLTFIDSSGLHAMLHVANRCRETGCALTIRPGPPNVQELFELTNTIERLPFERGH